MFRVGAASKLGLFQRRIAPCSRRIGMPQVASYAVSKPSLNQEEYLYSSPFGDVELPQNVTLTDYVFQVSCPLIDRGSEVVENVQLLLLGNSRMR